jgi:hypothetical protein
MYCGWILIGREGNETAWRLVRVATWHFGLFFILGERSSLFLPDPHLLPPESWLLPHSCASTWITGVELEPGEIRALNFGGFLFIFHVDGEGW